MNDTTSVLRVVGLTKSFGRHKILDGLSLSVARGEIVALAGESGVGKTTLFNIVAGFETCSDGAILVNGIDISSYPPYRRGVALVPQDYSLFPHMSVYDNLRFGFHNRPSESPNSRAVINEAAVACGISNLLERSPETLSGGEKQRVALVRSLVARSEIVLLDEPLGSLDTASRRRIVPWIRSVLKAHDRAAIYVSHTEEELYGIADRLAVMHAGAILEDASPESLYTRPRTRYVAEFIGGGNVSSQGDGSPVLVRPDHISDMPHSGWEDLGVAVVMQVQYMGGRYKAVAKLQSGGDVVYFTGEQKIVGSTVRLHRNPNGVVALEP
jgi:ABC-type Fe3+/spermidine/putrescine transport system ATPase subunit